MNPLLATPSVRLLLAALWLASFALSPAPARSAAKELSVTVDPAKTYQVIDGFGASLTDSSAWLIAKTLSAEQRLALLKELFDPNTGIGLSYLRQPMGSSDFRTREYTYDDAPLGTGDPKLERFSIAKDDDYLIPVLKQILTVNPRLKLMGSPWSAPAWMKESQRLDGGHMKNDNATYEAYAAYFARFLQAYSARGLTFDALTLQNEPMQDMAGYPTMGMQPADQARLAALVFRQIRAAGFKTKILVWDHNWDHPEFPLAVLSDPATQPFVDGVAFHGYGGNVAAQSTVHDSFPEKDIYFTECSGGSWAEDFSSNLIWDMSNLVVGATRNWAKTVLKWNLALDEKHGPKLPGGADNCRGMVTIHQASHQVTREVEYYALGHASKFVQPGARRIESDAAQSVAFLNPDGSLALILFNPGREEQSSRVRSAGASFACALPGRSVATFTWSAGQTGPVRVWLTTGDKSKLLARQADMAWSKP